MADSMPTKKQNNTIGKYITATFLLILLISSVALLLHLYYQQGVYWDFITHYMYSKALINSYFYKSMLNGTLPQAIQYEGNFYIEPFRAPLMSMLMAPFDLVFAQHAIPAYLVFEAVFLLLSAIYLAHSMKVSSLIVAPILMMPYVMVYLTVLNGAEMLSLILIVFAAALAMRGKWQSGVLMALAALAKYSSIAFVLPLLFMPKGTRRKSIAAVFLTTAPWLIANFFIFGNPIYSYESAITQVFVSPPPSQVSMHAALATSISIVFYDLLPFIILIAILALFVYSKHHRMPKAISYKYKIAITFCAVSLLAWFALAIHASINTLPRWGYLIYAGSAPLLSLLIYDLMRSASKLYKNYAVRRTITYAIYSTVLLISLVLTFIAYIQMGQYPFGAFMGSKSQILLDAVQQVNSLGLGSCNFISNAWPYLRFYGIAAHNPNYYNSTMYKYPILIFDSFIGSGNEVTAINITKVYNLSGFQIMIPKNSIC